jgi:hypothetical protein
MRLVTIVVASTLNLVFAYEVHAASQQDWSECAGRDLATALQACSRIVSDQAATPSDRADGYLFRAGAFFSQRNFDLAIADYTEAIRLAPQNVTAYGGRAIAYFQKGNLDQAAADFSIIYQLDSAKAVELAASNPDLNAIAALARRRTSTPSDARVAVRKPLPRNVGLSEEVINLLETNPLFAQADPIALRTFTIDVTSQNEFNGPLGRSTISSTGKNQNQVEDLGGGLVRFDFRSSNEQKTKASGKPAEISHSTMRRSGLAIGNGLFDLDTTMSFQIDGRSVLDGKKPVPKLLRIGKMSGKIFPVQINNHFSFTTVFKGTNGEESPTENDCVISREFDAKSFHPDLTGKAFLGICETFSDGSSKLTARYKKIYFQELGYWIQVDPVSPSEQLMQTNDTVTAETTTYKANGAFVLKSFTLGP